MIILKQKDTGVIKECTTGYSWTSFFFGGFVPLCRGDLKWAVILFVLSFLVAFCTAGFGVIFVSPVFGFFYNKVYIKDLVEKGYTYTDENSRLYLISNGVIAPAPAAE